MERTLATNERKEITEGSIKLQEEKEKKDNLGVTGKIFEARKAIMLKLCSK